MAFWLPLLAGLGSIFGGAAAGRKDAKESQAQAATQQNNSELARWTAMQNAEANRADTIAQRPTDRFRQGALGNLALGWTTPSVEWGGSGTIPKVSGGFAGVVPNQMMRANAELMQRDALMRQLQGQSAPDIARILPQPKMAEYPKSSWLDTVLGLGGLAGGLAGAWEDAKLSAGKSGGVVPYNPEPEDPWAQNPQIPRPRR